MIAVALKGLAGRKLRALLTALAIVLGVAMVSGTYILTDTMQKAFDGIFARPTSGTDAVVTGKQLVDSPPAGAPPSPPRCSTTIRALPEVEAAGGSLWTSRSSRTPAKLIEHDGKAIGAPERTLGVGIDPAGRALQPAQAQAGAWPHGARRDRDRRRDRREGATSRVGDTIGVAARPGAAVHGHRHRHLRRGRLARRRDASPSSTCRPRRRCSGKKGSFDTISVAATAAARPPSSSRADPAAAAAERRRSQTGDAQAARTPRTSTSA